MAAPRKKRVSGRQPAPSGPPASSAVPPPAAALSNLEMEGDRLKVFSLQTLLTNKRNPETRPVARLGDVLIPWFEKMVSKPAEKLSNVSGLWESLVPETLLKHTRLLGYHRGTLSVAVGSAPVRAQLDAALRGGLLRELQRASNGALYRVKTQVDAITPD